jgi:sulfate permease
VSWTLIAIIIALFFAANIGASGAAATMGPAYGSGAISKRNALFLVAIAAFLGAVLGSSAVVKTVGEGIIPSNILTVQIVVVILASATLTLFVANMMGIPLSTSEVTIGAIVGVGVAFQSVFTASVLKIVAFWVLVPIVAFIIAFLGAKLLILLEKRFPWIRNGGKWSKYFKVAVIVTGVVEAFSAGMNNVANAIGPLVGAAILSETKGIWLGALFLAIGAVALGGRVLETNGKKITNLTLLQGSMVSGTGGGLVIFASVLGIPVPLTQVTTTAILGVGIAENGYKMWQKGIIVKILKVWIVSPVLALIVSYSLIHLFIDPDPYKMTVVVGVLVATVFTMSLYQMILKEKAVIHDEGGGI